MVYFSSDFHYSHKNILEYDSRPFKTIEEHDETIIKNYNETVGNDDDFYFLGDFAFAGSEKVKGFLERMTGNKFFINGNHDKGNTIKLYQKYGTYLGPLANIVVEGQKIVLCHYSLRVWQGNSRGNIHLYGHSHGSLEKYPNGKSMDVGINVHNYKPISFEQIMEIMNKREVVALDHHIRKENYNEKKIN